MTKKTKANPFDYVRAIDQKNDVEDLSGFVPYLTNHHYSNHMDTCLLANELNARPNLPPLPQYDFLYSTVRKGKRYGKWYKAQDNPHLQTVMDHYQVNKYKALEMLTVLPQSELKRITELQEELS